MSHIFIDIRTLAFVLMLVTGLMAAMMFVFWRTQKTYPGVGYWALSNLSAAAGFFLIALRSAAPEIFTVVLGNTLAIGTLALAYEGNRRYRALTPNYFASLGIPAALGIVLAFFTYAVPDLNSRIIAVSAAAGLLAFLSVLVFWRPSARERKSVPFLIGGITYFVYGVIMTGQIGVAYALSDMNDLFTPDRIQSIFLMTFIVFAVVWTFNYVILNNERLHEELGAAEEVLVRLATTDYLTGLANNRAFFEFASAEIKRSRRHGIPMTLIVFDLDHFKAINDTHGHAAGDHVLRAVATLCTRITRQNDIMARIGGEEFGLLLTHAEPRRGRMVAEQLRKALEGLELDHNGTPIRITASFGVAGLRRSDTLATLLDRADENLYQAKADGRNRVAAESGDKPLRLLSTA
jgi:diguanylate cyclase (GGDEF)-like protein